MCECNLRKLKKHSDIILAKNVCTVHWSQKRCRRFTITAASDDNDQKSLCFVFSGIKPNLKSLFLVSSSCPVVYFVNVIWRIDRVNRITNNWVYPARNFAVNRRFLSLHFEAKIRRNSSLFSAENSLKKPRIVIRTFARNFEESSREQKTKLGHFACVTFAQYCTKNIYNRIWKHNGSYTNNSTHSPQAQWRLLNNRFNLVLEIVQQYSLHLPQINIKCTVLCRSNARKMCEFRFLF